ncbi:MULTISPECIES: hypothetical protein [unclassified Nocardioides]|uniref:hypothetical protein n=1 Tax=unclassified Nocardioides TaxID=2615069 RepID=UPI0006F36542|nr:MULTISPECIES: hypothetical protein [unclassified Nocardioides]KRA38750.1 hypothetical protein ASD81_09145 [Nocardioides sp. Root614]KRA92710.1 hypothetical protein ASD84_09410 [Nocardioides sp. Root682]
MRKLRSVLASGAATVLALTLAGSPATADDTTPALPGLSGLLPGLPALPTIPGLPIPSLPTDLLVPRFTGAAVTPQPISAPVVPQNPYLAPNGRSSMHNDAYSTDAYAVSGPTGRSLTLRSASYGVRECATIAFDSHDRIVGLCGGLEGFTMMVIDPVTLRAISQLQVSQRDFTSGANPLTDICGGTYFFLDGQDRAYATTTRSSIAEVTVTAAGGLVKGREWPLAGHLPAGDCLVATGVDWSGRVWWFSQQGVVGTLDRESGAVHAMALGEGIFNSVSTDETGGVYFVTTHQTYRADADSDGVPHVTWAIPYDRGSVKKPGMLSQGSGTSPTLIGERWIAVADNADPQSHVLVYDRRVGVTDRLHCSVPVLADGASTTENSLVAAGNSLIIENNYGYAGVQSTLLGKTTTPGVSRVMIEDDGCHVAWTNPTSAPTSVPKASLGNGLVYVYSKPPGTLLDAWYVTAIDIRTGKTAWSRLTGTGIQWNNHYASIYLGPDGTLYVATLIGLVRLADG